MVCSSDVASRCALEMKSCSESHALVLITNDVGRKFKQSGDSDTSTSTTVNYVVLRVLDFVGFNKTLYESNDPAVSKYLAFTDKATGKMTMKGCPMVLLSKTDDVTRLEWKSWKAHPSAMMKTEWRGVQTGIIGSILPGLPMTG